MRSSASTDKEVMLREINEVEEVLARASQLVECPCLIDPTETLADRVNLMATMFGALFVSMGTIAVNGRDQAMRNAHLADAHLDELEQEN